MHKRIWRTGAVLLALGLLLSSALASAEEETGELWLPGVWADEIWMDAETLGVSPDTRYPVYAAPYDDAWRPGNGQAELSTAEPFVILANAGEWRMVEYEVSDISNRVGWVRIPDPNEPLWEDFPNDASLLRLIRNENLTDDPWGSGRIVTRLREGDTVIGLARIIRDDDSLLNWAYVQTEVDGKTAWLFINPHALEEEPMYTVEGETLVIHEGVTRVGDTLLSWTDPDTGFPEDVHIPLRKDEICASLLELAEYNLSYDEENDMWTGGVRLVELPASLTAIGGSAFYMGRLTEFRFPENLEYLSSAAFYGVEIGKVIIPAGFRCDGPVGNCYDECSVGEFFVEEGNPLYSSRDGVLFNADGTVLIRYPDGKKDLHYDVPAGVVEIAEGAFGSDWMDNPLQTISLPMGLKKIGRYAFSGCGRLNSLTVPLTVTEIGAHAFRGCTSLERLSLPPWLSVKMEDDWTEYGDFTWYNGDNGTTLPKPKVNAWEEGWE